MTAAAAPTGGCSVPTHAARASSVVCLDSGDDRHVARLPVSISPAPPQGWIPHPFHAPAYPALYPMFSAYPVYPPYHPYLAHPPFPTLFPPDLSGPVTSAPSLRFADASFSFSQPPSGGSRPCPGRDAPPASTPDDPRPTAVEPTPPALPYLPPYGHGYATTSDGYDAFGLPPSFYGPLPPPQLTYPYPPPPIVTLRPWPPQPSTPLYGPNDGVSYGVEPSSSTQAPPPTKTFVSLARPPGLPAEEAVKRPEAGSLPDTRPRRPTTTVSHAHAIPFGSSSSAAARKAVPPTSSAKPPVPDGRTPAPSQTTSAPPRSTASTDREPRPSLCTDVLAPPNLVRAREATATRSASETALSSATTIGSAHRTPVDSQNRPARSEPLIDRRQDEPGPSPPSSSGAAETSTGRGSSEPVSEPVPHAGSVTGPLPTRYQPARRVAVRRVTATEPYGLPRQPLPSFANSNADRAAGQGSSLSTTKKKLYRPLRPFRCPSLLCSSTFSTQETLAEHRKETCGKGPVQSVRKHPVVAPSERVGPLLVAPH